MKANNNPLRQEETRIDNEIAVHTPQLLQEWAGSTPGYIHIFLLALHHRLHFSCGILVVRYCLCFSCALFVKYHFNRFVNSMEYICLFCWFVGIYVVDIYGT